VPTILRVDDLRIAIFTDDHEPAHVHVQHPDGIVVVLLDARTRRAVLRGRSRGVSARDTRRIVEIVGEHFETLFAAWERLHR